MEESRTGRTVLYEPAQGDYTALVAEHSRALGQMSKEIAAVIRKMEARAKRLTA